MFENLKKQVLDSKIELKSCNISGEGTTSFIVATKWAPFRLLFLILFGLPALLLILVAASFQNTLFAVIAWIFSAGFAGLAAFSCFATQRKIFSLGQGRLLKSVWLGKWGFAAESSLPTTGTVQIEAKWSTGGKATMGAYMEYIVTVKDCEGSGFSTFSKYSLASDFAQKLAGFLSFQIENKVEEQFRVDK